MSTAATRAHRHLDAVSWRLERSRYDGARGLDEPDDARLLVLDPRRADTAAVRVHPALTLRLATAPLDLEQVAVVVSSASGLDLDEVRRDRGANLRHVDGGTTLVAERGRNVVGAAWMVLTEDAEGTVAGLHLLAVAPRFQRRGYGAALVARALELAAGAGADLFVAWSTPAAEPTLRRLGLTPPR